VHRLKSTKAINFRILGWCSHDSRNYGWGYSKMILQKLKRDGWCAKAVRILQALLRGNTIGLLYLHTLRDSSAKGPDHVMCTATECREKDHRISQRQSINPVPYHHCSALLCDHCSEPVDYYTRPNQTPKQPICSTSNSFNGEIRGQARPCAHC